MKKTLLTLLSAIALLPVLGQESIIKEFSEPRRPTRWMNPICLYASTLRMVNIADDPNFNEMVNDIEKVLIYTLDSATIANREYKDWLKEYEDIGYEEYITMYGEQEMRIIGKDEEYVGLMAIEDRVITFYLRGEIPFHKIPALMNTFQSDNVLSMITDQFK